MREQENLGELQEMDSDEQQDNISQYTTLDDYFVTAEHEDHSIDEVVGEELQINEPIKGMIFDNIDDAFHFCKRYARTKGFAITKRSSRTGEDKEVVQYITLACSRQGKALCSSKNAFKPNPSVRIDCPVKLNFTLHGPDKKYRLSSLTLEHNHDLSLGKASHILSILPIMKIKEVPSKYILQRWRKDIKRKHTFIKSSYDDCIDTPVARRYDELCKSFSEVAEDGAESDALFEFVIGGIKDLKIETIVARQNIHQAQESTPPNCSDEGTHNNGKAILNPIPAQRVGRPPSDRKESKIDNKVRNMRGKKQGSSTKSIDSQNGRGKKAKKISQNTQVTSAEHELINMPYNGDCTNLQSSQQVPTANEPVLPFEISSYVNLLQIESKIVQQMSSVTGTVDLNDDRLKLSMGWASVTAAEEDDEKTRKKGKQRLSRSRKFGRIRKTGPNSDVDRFVLASYRNPSYV
ncbi:hypothetical protein PR202_gb22819 [Eleusine coracana subsp. coracana]|uniref:FAR1 domain-containing protein n=1 Tax=Eleusine coracana subsp. coracana TaxID=191504 RepID=A0AAV5FGR3_ELECO|nr:hypothetical protein PR202_gb22819 [Eleusine coracana subsp. coracana]